MPFFLPYFNATTARSCWLAGALRIQVQVCQNPHVTPSYKEFYFSSPCAAGERNAKITANNYNTLLSLRVRASVRFLNKCQAGRMLWRIMQETRAKNSSKCAHVRMSNLTKYIAPLEGKRFDMKTFIYAKFN